jgi:hypothetical protein
MRTLAALLFLFFVAEAAIADCGEVEDICAANSLWAQSHTASVRVQREKNPDFALWEFTFGAGNDLLLKINSHQGKTQTRGTILLVSGRAMLTKDLAIHRGYEIDALDAPILMYQLVVSLLSQAVPEGPDKLAASRKISVSESKRAIRIATQSASGRFPPPWRVNGSINKKGPLQFEYSLTLAYPTEDNHKMATMVLSGKWNKVSAPLTLKDTMSIEGWSLHTIGPFSVKQEGITVFDYGAQAKPSEIRSLGELRKALAKDEASSN